MQTLNFKIENHTALVTLNRPDVRNAFNDSMIAEMTQLFKELQGNQQIRAVFLSGAGESFCAGGDLGWMQSMVGYTERENFKDSELLFEMYEALQKIPVPVVTLVHGHAMGGALGLIAASDIVFVVDGTQLCFSEVRLGLAPAVISAFVKDKILARDMARYFLTAEVFGPEQAFQMGLIHEFGSAKEMQALSEKTLKKILGNGPVAVRETKKLISDLTFVDDVKKTTSELIAQLRVSSEGQEGLKAFFEKRKPNWMDS